MVPPGAMPSVNNVFISIYSRVQPGRSVSHASFPYEVFFSACRIHNQPARYDSKEGRWSDAGLVQLSPFLSSTTGSLNAAGLSALLRVFFFLCKAAKVFSPVVEICRYHVLAKRSSNLLIAIVEGLLCWPQVLLCHDRFGKICELI